MGKKRNAVKSYCAPKPGFIGYVAEQDDKTLTYRWIDVVSIAN